MTTPRCSDPVVLNLWHALAAVAETRPHHVHCTTLLEEPISYAHDGDGQVLAWRSGAIPVGTRVDLDVLTADVEPLPSRLEYGYVWASLGDPIDLFEIPEFAEPDRRNLNASTIGVHVSPPRAIENFLDMAHFPFVHTGVLGAEPHTEVREYDVTITEGTDEIIASQCTMFQPQASAASTGGGTDVDYTYRVPHPFCGVLYKSNDTDPTRQDVIAVFVQPIDEEHARAHLMLCVLDEVHEDKYIRNFQQGIFGQDKPILENQYPKKLPLDPRWETPIRADKSSVAYRRWLTRKGVRYGTIGGERIEVSA